jgi:hypothetical protein
LRFISIPVRDGKNLEKHTISEHFSFLTAWEEFCNSLDDKLKIFFQHLPSGIGLAELLSGEMKTRSNSAERRTGHEAYDLSSTGSNIKRVGAAKR